MDWFDFQVKQCAKSLLDHIYVAAYLLQYKII